MEKEKMDLAMARLAGPVTCLDDLTGREFESVEVSDDELVLHINSVQRVYFHHHQDCCESVWLADVCGDLKDLIDSPVVYVEARTSDGSDDEDCSESRTWTFYSIQTRKGCVDFRWCGESNGYYSEGVSIDFDNPD